MDLCVVRTIGFKALYVLVIMEHGSRRIRHWNVTDSPSMDWIIQQLREATPFGEVPRFLHRDNDRLYGKGVSKFLKDSFIEDVRSAFGAHSDEVGHPFQKYSDTCSDSYRTLLGAERRCPEILK